MSEEKPKKKRKKSAAEGDGTQEKEHKKNWREVYASVGDIKAFLGGRLYLRHNVTAVELRDRRHRLAAHLRPRRELTLGGAVAGEARPRTGHVPRDGVGLRKGIPSISLLPRPPAAMGRAGLYHRTVGVHHHPRGRGEADALLRIPEEVARGYGGRMGRRECR